MKPAPASVAHYFVPQSVIQPLGEHRFKNIGPMVHVYRLLGEPTKILQT